MNRRLSEHQIRTTCRELAAARSRVTGRGLCQELRDRFGAVGKTNRVFRIWREELGANASPGALPSDPGELQRRVAVAEAVAAENLARAERAEFRERAHQDKWAMEIDRLRQELSAQKANAAAVRMLTDRVQQLSWELVAARGGRS